MVTEIGKFLRVLRAKNLETAKEMAKKLNVSPTYLSAVELGRRDNPLDWLEIIKKEYNLSDKDTERLHLAISESKATVKFDLNDVDNKKKDLILSVAKNDLDDKTIEKLCEIINKSKEGV